MNKLLIPMMLILTTAQAGVFKCETAEGKVEYQDQPCKKGMEQSTVPIEKMDPNKIAQAKQKMAAELAQWDELQHSRAEAAQQQRMINALDRDARAQQDLVDATRQQTDAIDDNTNAMQNRNIGYRPYYYPRPIAKPYKRSLANRNNTMAAREAGEANTGVDKLKVMVK